MLPVKANYGDRYVNKTCRLCQEEDETQRHVLNECKMTKEKAKHIEYIKYFTEDDQETMTLMAENSTRVAELLEEKHYSHKDG